MSLHRGQFQKVITETIKTIDFYSEDAVYQLLGTAAQESKFGHYLDQLGGGPAEGFLQVERNTEKDNWVNYLEYRPELAHKIIAVSSLLNPFPVAPVIRYQNTAHRGS